jgi:hypothetical protein
MKEPSETLARILDAPHLERVVPRLQPALLHRVIERCGLEDCGQLVALATPTQLSGIFDLDLWRAAKPGLDEQFDAGRFGQWLEVLADCGAEVAAGKLAGMDLDLVSAALAQHIRVFDLGAVTPYVTLDGELETFYQRDDELSREIGRFVVVGRRSDAWHATLDLLTALSDLHPDRFVELMGRCVELSDGDYEVDGLDDLLTDRDQATFDAGSARQTRRDAAGYVAPADARAFLEIARTLRLDAAAPPRANPLAAAYVRALREAAPVDAGEVPGERSVPSDPETARHVAAMVDVLREEGVIPQAPRALLGAAAEPAPRLARIQAHMQALAGTDLSAYHARMGELAFLANTLMAGCGFQTRTFTEQEASEAAAALCNLGFENWPARWLPAPRDLVSVFQVGWTVLHDDVAMHAAGELLSALVPVRCADRQIQDDLDALRADMTRWWRAGTPWRARDALDVIAILDTLAWTALLGLTDECPVLHAAIRAVPGSGTRAVPAAQFEFISENRQIADIHAFLRTLPDALRG